MKIANDTEFILTPEVVLRAYEVGVFPMAEAVDSDKIYWVDPRMRGIIPMDGFHLSRSLARVLRRAEYDIGINRDFSAIIDACADRPETWINDEIRRLFIDLHRMGHAHSIGVWHRDVLIGGVYGLALGAAFFGESMFSRKANGSKIALAHLMARLRFGGFSLMDTQFITPHLQRLGARNISRARYHQLLTLALAEQGHFDGFCEDHVPARVIQLITQRS